MCQFELLTVLFKNSNNLNSYAQEKFGSVTKEDK
jgi:hypothetical protein